MSKSITERVADGETALFSFDFGYIDRDHISVDVNGTPAGFSWSSDFVILLDELPRRGAVIRIKRTTPTAPYIDYNDAATLSADELDTALQQPLYAVEELIEQFDPFGDIGDIGELNLPDLSDLHIIYADALGEEPEDDGSLPEDGNPFLEAYQG